MRYKRETLQDMTRPLKQWLYKNKNNPYPSKRQKSDLADESHMTLTQVSNWFANARRRLKNTVKGQELSWEKRVKMYDSSIKGHQEALNMESEDSAWESGDDDLRDLQCHEQPDLLKDTENGANQPPPPTAIPTSTALDQETLPETLEQKPEPKPDLLHPHSNEEPLLGPCEGPSSSASGSTSSMPNIPTPQIPSQYPFWPATVSSSENGSNVAPLQSRSMTFLPQNLLPTPIMQPAPLLKPQLTNQLAEEQTLTNMKKEEEEVADFYNNNHHIARPKSREISENGDLPKFEENEANVDKTNGIAENAVGTNNMPIPTPNPMLPYMLGLNPTSTIPMTPGSLLSPLAAHIYTYLMQCEQIKNAGGVPAGLDVAKLLPLISLASPIPSVAVTAAQTMAAAATMDAHTATRPTSVLDAVPPKDFASEMGTYGSGSAVPSPAESTNRDFGMTGISGFCPNNQSTPILSTQHSDHSDQSQRQANGNVDLHRQLPCRQCSTTECHVNETSQTDIHRQTPPECIAYPKSETPKYKNALLQRYLHGNLENKFPDGQNVAENRQTFEGVESSPLPPPMDFMDDSGIQTTPVSTSSTPLDLRKRIRNLSGSVGSQDYENVSEADVSSLETAMVNRPPSSVYSTEGVASPTQTWNPSLIQNGSMETQPQISEDEDLAMKEMCAIFTLANLARSRSERGQPVTSL